MPLRLYTDECVDARIVAGLRRRGVHVTTAADENLLGADDEVHFDRANELGLVIVTADHDFLNLVHERSDGHHGLLFILPRTSVGDAVRAIALAADILEPAEIENWIEWIP